jgi:hypothetical protein
VDLRPRLNEPLLCLGQAATETLDRVDCEHRRVILVKRVEMCAVMLTASFNEHPNHYPEEPRKFRHVQLRPNSRVLTCGFSRGGSGLRQQPSAASRS